MSVTISHVIAFLWRFMWTGDATAKVAPIKVRIVEERILRGVGVGVGVGVFWLVDIKFE
jgi:hypothetical protein